MKFFISTFLFSLILPDLCQAALTKQTIYTIGHLSTESLVIRQYENKEKEQVYGVLLMQGERMIANRMLWENEFRSYEDRIQRIFPKEFIKKQIIENRPCDEVLAISEDYGQNSSIGNLCLSGISQSTRKDFLVWWQSLRKKVLTGD